MGSYRSLVLIDAVSFFRQLVHLTDGDGNPPRHSGSNNGRPENSSLTLGAVEHAERSAARGTIWRPLFRQINGPSVMYHSGGMWKINDEESPSACWLVPFCADLLAPQDSLSGWYYAIVSQRPSWKALGAKLG